MHYLYLEFLIIFVYLGGAYAAVFNFYSWLCAQRTKDTYKAKALLPELSPLCFYPYEATVIYEENAAKRQRQESKKAKKKIGRTKAQSIPTSFWSFGARRVGISL